MKFARIFIKPDGQRWLDLPLQSDQSMQNVMSALRGEGALVHETFYMPADSIHFIALLTLQEDTGNMPIPASGKLN